MTFEGQLGGEKRRVTVNEYKGTKLVNIREYFQKDSSWRPGSKGIALTVAQWQALMSHAKQINAELGLSEDQANESEPARKKNKKAVVDKNPVKAEQVEKKPEADEEEEDEYSD